MPCRPTTRGPVSLAAALVAATLAGAAALGSAPARAAGFQLNETSAAGLGNAYAGGAAVAEDASTLWSNPAGLSRLGQRQVAGVLHLITPSIRFRNDASVAAVAQTLGGNGGDAGGLNVVPNLYLAVPVNRDLVLGLGVNAPWGLVTDYDRGWAGRFQADKSDIATLNVNPGLSFKLSNSLALGAGLNWQRMLAEFSNDVNYSAALLAAARANGIAAGSATFNAIAAATAGQTAHAIIKGSDNAWGWNLGVLWVPNKDQRLGLSYRSAITYHIDGRARFSNPDVAVAGPLGPTVAALANGVNALATFDTGVRADVKLPPIANASYVHQLSPAWDLLVDLQWTGWSTIESLRFVRSDGTLLQETPEHFKDSWKLAVGANWRLGGPWTLKGGVARDQTPVRDRFRTPRLPDGDRTWLGAGLQYQAGRELRLDLGAAYIWVKKTRLHDDQSASAAGVLDGHYKSHTTVLSGQATWSF